MQLGQQNKLGGVEDEEYRERRQREKLLNSLGKLSFIPSVQKEETLEHMLNSCELTCVRAKPIQSSITQSSPLLQTELDSPSIRSSTKLKQSSDRCVCTNTNQKRWLSGTSWRPYNTLVVGSSGPLLCLWWNCWSHPCG